MTDKIKTFSKFGDAGHGGITRYSLSPEAIMARNEFLKRMCMKFMQYSKDWRIFWESTIVGKNKICYTKPSQFWQNRERAGQVPIRWLAL